jgi:hypothetical protein
MVLQKLSTRDSLYETIDILLHSSTIKDRNLFLLEAFLEESICLLKVLLQYLHIFILFMKDDKNQIKLKAMIPYEVKTFI